MTIFVYRNGVLVNKNKAGPKNEKLGKASYVISDIMPSTKHMANGQFYESKSAFRAATKADGCLEVGNETSTLLKPRQKVELDRGARRESIQRAVYELRNR